MKTNDDARDERTARRLCELRTGTDARIVRELLGATMRQVANGAGVHMGNMREWESSPDELGPHAREKLLYGLRRYARQAHDQILASGLTLADVPDSDTKTVLKILLETWGDVKS